MISLKLLANVVRAMIEENIAGFKAGDKRIAQSLGLEEWRFLVFL
jgi:hypothetical protein